MKKTVETAVWLVRAVQSAWGRKWSFVAFFACVFLGSTFFLARYDLLPGPAAPDGARAAIAQIATTTAAGADTMPAVVEIPVKVVAEKIGLSALVENPTSTDVAVLDAALLRGAVRYPTSAKLGENGNVVLFGHSSYLPIVHNRAYKTFDGIQKLVKGDTLTVYSSTRIYTYAVQRVEKADANGGAIPLAVSGRVLTLSTCDSFGTKSDRFVVTAEFVESKVIPTKSG
jgi:LPXTG-site transpeptidase (sortase) family protein